MEDHKMNIKTPDLVFTRLASSIFRTVFHFLSETNCFNLTSSNSEILIIRPFRRVVPRLEVLLFIRKKALSMKQADLRDMFIKACRCVCTSTVVLSLDPLSPAPSTNSVMMMAENTEEDRYDPHTADEGDNQIEYTSN